MNLKQIFLTALLVFSCASIKSAENSLSPENQTKPTTQEIFAAFQKLMRENRALKDEVARLQEEIKQLKQELNAKSENESANEDLVAADNNEQEVAEQANNFAAGE